MQNIASDQTMFIISYFFPTQAVLKQKINIQNVLGSKIWAGLI